MHPRWHQRQARLKVKSWTSGRDAIRSIPGTSPPHLGGRTRRVETAPASVRDKVRPGWKSFWCKVCLHPHLEQGGTPPVEKWQWSLFSLLQMGANNSSLTPLKCILKSWDRFDPQGLKETLLIFLCDTAWPRYPLEDADGGQLEDLLIIILFGN